MDNSQSKTQTFCKRSSPAMDKTIVRNTVICLKLKSYLYSGELILIKTSSLILYISYYTSKTILLGCPRLLGACLWGATGMSAWKQWLTVSDLLAVQLLHDNKFKRHCLDVQYNFTHCHYYLILKPTLDRVALAHLVSTGLHCRRSWVWSQS